MWSNFRMGFVVNSFWVLMKSFQKSPEMPVITCVSLSLPWTDGEVPGEIASEWCFLIRMWAAMTRVLGNTCTSFGVQVKGHSLLQGPADRVSFFSGLSFIQSTGYLHVQSRWLWAQAWYIFQLHWRKWFAVAKGTSTWHVPLLFRKTIWIPVNKVFKHKCVWLFSNEPCSQALQG